MAQPGIDFRFSNQADWREEFAVLVGSPIAPPWQGATGVPGIPAFKPGATYGLASACVSGGDLYVARPDAGAGAWTAAPTFDTDLLPSGLSRWMLAVSADAYAHKPFDLTGAAILLGLKACDADGNITDPRPKLRTGSADGGFVITNARLGGVAFAVPLYRTRGIAAGLYRYDIAAVWNSRTERVRYGLILVDDGCTA